MSEFKLKKCTKCSEDRQFKNGLCVFNNTIGMAYSADEIVEVLNKDDYYSKIHDLLQNKIWYHEHMYNETGDDFHKHSVIILRELRDESYEPYHHSSKYGEYLEKWFLESLEK